MKATLLGLALIVALTGFAMPLLVETPTDAMRERLAQIGPPATPCLH